MFLLRGTSGQGAILVHKTRQDKALQNMVRDGRIPQKGLSHADSFNVLPLFLGSVAMDYLAHIARDPRICGGEPVITGTRVTLRTVLASLAEGAGVADILADFPTLTAEDVRAVVAFAASSTEEDLPVPSAPALHAN